MVDDNIKTHDARKLKSDIYFGLQQFKRDGQDLEINQSIDHKSVQGKLKQQTGLLRLFLNIRMHFALKKIIIDKNNFI